MEIVELNFMDWFSVSSSPIFLAKSLINMIIQFFIWHCQTQMKSMSKYVTEFSRAKLDVELSNRPG